MLTIEELKERHKKIKEESNITYISCRPYKLAELPEIGKKYYAYDDGKIRVSREYEVLIHELCVLDTLPDDVKEVWQNEVLDCHWLYDPNGLEFIRATDLEANAPCWFGRTQDGGWFTFNSPSWNCGRLDIDGSLYKLAHENC